MGDRVTAEQRSRNMSRVKNKNTSPEIEVRRLLHRMGFRFRLHRRDLPGHPDIVLPKYRTVIFVHGCFWHGHECRRGARPVSNQEFWNQKLDKNIARDRDNVHKLEQLGWKTIIVWQCELSKKNRIALAEKLRETLLSMNYPKMDPTSV